jgi:hypothetical protein
VGLTESFSTFTELLNAHGWIKKLFLKFLLILKFIYFWPCLNEEGLLYIIACMKIE